MPHDYLGNPVGADSAAGLAAIDDFIGGFLAYENRAQHIIAAAAQAPGAVLVNAYAGFLHMFLEADEAPRLASPYLRNAERGLAHAGERERLSVALLRAWVEDDLERALALIEQLLARFPRELFAAKLGQYLEFNRGNSPAMLRLGLAAVAAAPEIAHAHGMLAFAYEQCHLLEQAEQAARRAIALQRKEPWAQHALAHVLLTQGRIAEGTAFLEGVRDTWDGLNSFMYTHNWWHLALFYLARGREAEVLEIYDRHVWGIFPEYSQDQVGAVSLLARLELAGVEVGTRWQALAEYLVARAEDTVQPFLSLQYLYGLARAGRPEAQRLLLALRQRAEQAPAYSRATWAEITLPVAEGLLAHVAGDHARAARLLGQALPLLTAIGGSHAQRDLFALIEQDAILRSGQRVRAQQVLELRRGFDGDDVPSNRALARLYRELGLPGEAARAEARLARVLERT